MNKLIKINVLIFFSLTPACSSGGNVSLDVYGAKLGMEATEAISLMQAGLGDQGPVRLRFDTSMAGMMLAKPCSSQAVQHMSNDGRPRDNFLQQHCFSAVILESPKRRAFIKLVEHPEGRGSIAVRYSISLSGVDQDFVTNKAVEKYGSPTRTVSYGTGLCWEWGKNNTAFLQICEAGQTGIQIEFKDYSLEQAATDAYARRTGKVTRPSL